MRRQDSPPVFDMTTAVYVLRARFVLQSQGMFTGRTSAIVIPKERSIDIDTLHDFDIADYLMTKRKLSTPC